MNENKKKTKGYFYDARRNQYRVRFSFEGKVYCLGRYETPEIAHHQYILALGKLKYAQAEAKEKTSGNN